MKLAHLFLIRDGLNQERLWQRFFHGHESQYSMYVHAKSPAQIASDWLRSKLISRHCQTERGTVSLVEAELLLLEAALQDEANQFFLLHSENCVPLRSFEHVYRSLADVNRSWMFFVRGNLERYERVNQSLIRLEHFYKSSQFFCLSRPHAQLLLEKTDLPSWRLVDCSDEHWAATLLTAHGQQEKCWKRDVTIAFWGSDPRSPRTFHALLPQDVEQLENASALFARKFAPDSDIADFAPLAVPPRTAPDVSEAYGPHTCQVLNLWKAKSDRPTGLVVSIDGGDFRSGRPAQLNPALLRGLLRRGVSVATIAHRSSPSVRFPVHYLDCARAIQFLRYRAQEWNLDPRRVGAVGESGAILWLGFHADLADSAHDDPVLRESSRLGSLVVYGAQTSYDPRVIRDWIGDAAAHHPALWDFYGLAPDERDTPAAHRLYEAASPITHVTRDAPPVLAIYFESRGPLPPNAPLGVGFHHINFGLRLKERMDALGGTCTIRHNSEGIDVVRETIDFLVKHLEKADA